MPYHLDLEKLRRANRLRLPQFRDKKGNLCHTGDDGKDWALSRWGNAITGELGEACNLIKKVERGDYTLDEVRIALAKELADVVCYVDLLACAADIDLSLAIVEKFNEVSKRVNSDVELEGWAGFGE